MSVDTSIEDFPHIHEEDPFDLGEDHSSNGHFQWKSVGFHLNRHIIHVAYILVRSALIWL